MCMPEILRVFGYKFFFYSREHEPAHVHIKGAEKSCKIEIDNLKVIKNKGFKTKELKILKEVIKNNKDLFIERWQEYFKDEES